MPFRVFLIPAQGGAEYEAPLNSFMRSHRILRVEKQFGENDSGGYWTFCIEYEESRAPSGPSSGKSTPKVDYSELLSKSDYKLYLSLHKLRKEIAKSDGVALYMIFNNEHLAQMSEKRCKTAADLAKIDGVGAGRIEKYGERFLKAIADATGGSDETREPLA